MKITAVTRLKQGDLYQLLKKLGWSNAELSRRTGINQSTIGGFLNMKRRPNEKSAQKIQEAFAKEGEFLDILEAWPETFRGFGKSLVMERNEDVTIEFLSLTKKHHEIESPRQNLEVLRIAIDECMEGMSEVHRNIITRRFIQDKTVDEARRGLGSGGWDVCRQRVHELESSAMRKMRQLSKVRILEKHGLVEVDKDGEVSLTI